MTVMDMMDVRMPLPAAIISVAFLVSIVDVGRGDTNRLLTFHTTDDFLNTCMLGKYHKEKPSPQSDLFQQCTPWKGRSCCHGNTTEAFHKADRWLNFNWDHCPGHKMSDKCRRHFVQDLCFYECSPNLGPWLVEVNRKLSAERAVYVPLCKSQCDDWWNDCKEDYTCKDNWGRGFDWSTGTNTCPQGTVCDTFQFHFKNATRFCEQIWDHSWKVVEDSMSCMKIWFEDTTANPNDIVAKEKASYLVQTINSSTKSGYSLVMFLLSVFCILLLR